MAKKQQGAEEEGEKIGPWILSYADMITCCMCVFVMLVSMATFSDSKVKNVLGSLQGAFSVMKGGGPTTAITKSTMRSIDGLATGSLENMKKFIERISSDLIGSAPQAKGVAIDYDPRERGIVIHLPEGILFDPGSAIPNEASHPILRELAYIIVKLPKYDIQVSGHTDSTSSPNESNWMLGARRAINVLEYLLEIDIDGKMIPQERMSASSYGSSRPIRDDSTTEHRALNRRVDIILREPIEGESLGD